jgi:multicomponent Na+:H+ antiporter subunit D
VLTPPIPVVLPLVLAAILAIGYRILPRWLAAFLAIGAAVTVACVALSMIVYSRDAGLVVYWFGGWTPRGGHAPGIGFAIDNAGAMLVFLAGTLTAMAMIFDFHSDEPGGAYFHALMVLFLAGADGVSLTGDVFNLFLCFALMSAAAIAICGVGSHGAIHFAVANTIAAVLVSGGIALLYNRTGSLNLAEIGRALGTHADAVTIGALMLIVCGFLIDAAAVPFHLWAADALEDACAPVAALVSGIMVELALYAAVRIYWASFSGALATHADALRSVLAAFGAVTALAGAASCFAERNLKRLLAFSLTAHVGVTIVGVALWAPMALAGVELYLVGQAMLHSGLFLAAGVLLFRTGTIDGLELHGRASRPGWLAVLFFFGAVGLCGVPPFATFWGDAMLDRAAFHSAYGWIAWVSFAAEALTAAALFRFAGRAFFGWGPAPAGESRAKTRGRTPLTMYFAASALVFGGALAGMAPRLTGAAQSAALYLEDRAGYAQRVLDGLTPYPPAVHDVPATAGDLARALATLACSLALARVAARPTSAIAARLRAVTRTSIPGAVLWLFCGAAVFAAVACLWIL